MKIKKKKKVSPVQKRVYDALKAVEEAKKWERIAKLEFLDSSAKTIEAEMELEEAAKAALEESKK